MQILEDALKGAPYPVCAEVNIQLRMPALSSLSDGRLTLRRVWYAIVPPPPRFFTSDSEPVQMRRASLCVPIG